MWESVGGQQTETVYIFTVPVIGRLCSSKPPSTKCVLVAALRDKMAISTISQPCISFQQILAVTGAYEWNTEIAWTEVIRLSEQDEGWNLRNYRKDTAAKWIICQIVRRTKAETNKSVVATWKHRNLKTRQVRDSIDAPTFQEHLWSVDRFSRFVAKLSVRRWNPMVMVSTQAGLLTMYVSKRLFSPWLQSNVCHKAQSLAHLFLLYTLLWMC